MGNWILIERLAASPASQQGRCLGLLPALLGRTSLLKIQQSHRPPANSGSRQYQEQNQMELLLQCEAAAAQKPRIAVLRHPAVGRSIAFSLDSTARLAATISCEQLAKCFLRHRLEFVIVAASWWLESFRTLAFPDFPYS